MGRLEDIAEKRAFVGFSETFPGVKFDRHNADHVRFIKGRIRDHLNIMRENIAKRPK